MHRIRRARFGDIAPWLVTASAVVLALAGATAMILGVGGERPDDRVLPAAAPATVPPTSAPPADAPANTTAYDIRTLRPIDVWSVTPSIAVDDAPFAAMTGELARPRSGAPIFTDPAGQPVGYLPRDAAYGGTTVPVVAHQTNWVKVLLAGRQGVPPEGNPAQTVGWLRVADVDITPVQAYVDVHLADHTIDIVSASGVERVANDFAWGTPSTPTPVGRTFVMLTRVVPQFAYTQGHPLVYLGVQSTAMAGFDGGTVAVTAFHYYRERSGANSFGCVYLDGPSVDRLAQLPPGTPVVIYP